MEDLTKNGLLNAIAHCSRYGMIQLTPRFLESLYAAKKIINKHESTFWKEVKDYNAIDCLTVTASYLFLKASTEEEILSVVNVIKPIIKGNEKISRELQK